MLHSIETSQDDNWNISGSDDECDLPHKFKNPSKYETDMKRKKKKLMNGNSNSIPRKVALLYKDIEKNGWIELQCKCPRRGKPESQSLSQSSASSVSKQLENVLMAKDSGQYLMKQKNRNEVPGFDYKEDEERPFIAKPSLKKTPVSVKRAKKVASMANVVNDLFRHKMLDEIESGAFEKECKNMSDDKDPRGKLEFENQDKDLARP